MPCVMRCRKMRVAIQSELMFASTMSLPLAMLNPVVLNSFEQNRSQLNLFDKQLSFSDEAKKKKTMSF